jgi:nitrogen-specific signal transduction histidine kinase
MAKKTPGLSRDLGRAYAAGGRTVTSLLASYEQLRYLLLQVRPSAHSNEASFLAWSEQVEEATEMLLRAAVDVRSAHLRGEFQAARDEAVRQMAAAIPDTVYGPLAEVHGWAELLAEHVTEDPELRYMCEQLHIATERLIAALDALRAATHHVTKRYSNGIEILDAERAAQPLTPPGRASGLS